jgi:hypothetical protein
MDYLTNLPHRSWDILGDMHTQISLFSNFFSFKNPTSNLLGGRAERKDKNGQGIISVTRSIGKHFRRVFVEPIQ